MTVKQVKLIALVLCAALMLSGCNLIRTNPEYTAQLEKEKAEAEQAAYDADMATVMAAYKDDSEDGRGEVTKGEIVDELNTQANINYMYMNSMYSMFGGGSYSLTADDLNGIKQTVIQNIAKQEILNVKMRELGFADFTQEELDEMRAQAKDEYGDYAAYTQMMGAESNMVASYLMMQGITEDTLYTDILSTRVNERLSSVVNAETAVSEEEIAAKYAQLLEEARTKYTQSPAELETLGQTGGAIYYMPEGFKYVKHVFLRPEDDAVMTAVSTAKSAMESAQSEIDALNAQIETAKNATPSEATAGEAADIPALEAQLAGKTQTLAEMTSAYDESVKAAWASVQAQVDEVLSAIEAGEDFDALIEKYSKDTGSTMETIKKNGYLVYKDATTWDPAFLAAANSLSTVGEIAQPVLGTMGVHIVKYEAAPVVGDAAFETVRTDAEAQALTAKKNTILSEQEVKWVEEAAVEYFYDAWVIK